jgi:hypothetical protein
MDALNYNKKVTKVQKVNYKSWQVGTNLVPKNLNFIYLLI